MINKIAFSNFRRFAKFPNIDLGDITILVGGNNSGKSTLVKALLLCLDNLRLMRMNDRRRGESDSPLLFSKPVFRFDANEYHDVKVKTFARAIHNKPVKVTDIFSGKETEELPSTITFNFTVGRFDFIIVVSGDRDSKKNITTGDVDSISITDTKYQVRYTNNYNTHSMSYEVLNSDFQEQLNLAKKLWQDYRTAKEALDKANEQGDLDEISDKAASLSKIESQIKSMNDMDDDSEELSEEDIKKMISSSLKETKPYKASYDMPLGIYYGMVAEPVVLNVISNILNFATTKGDAPKEAKDEDPNVFGARLNEFMLMESYREAMAQEVDTIRRSYKDLKDLLGQIDVEYISAHAANQNALYNTADRNDYIAQTIHEFYREKILKGEDEYEFVKKWMIEFEIGIDFDITSIDGEAYQVRIVESENTSVPLADKGMGSIQIMILLLRLATIIRRNRKNKHIRPMVVIEEPEQNLHPKMQSKLANLFFSLAAEDERCFFLIETHSEYLIRNTQVIVAQEDLDEVELHEMNSFKVYYLPSDDTTPYEMRYRSDGCFENDFGEGFFDEAENLAFKVL